MLGMGPGRLELPTSPLSGARSNQLSYEPSDGVWYGRRCRKSNRIGPRLRRHRLAVTTMAARLIIHTSDFVHRVSMDFLHPRGDRDTPFVVFEASGKIFFYFPLYAIWGYRTSQILCATTVKFSEVPDVRGHHHTRAVQPPSVRGFL